MITEAFKTEKRYMTLVHFNRINMQRGNPRVWTVHNRLGCFQVKDVDIRCPMRTRFRPNGTQPRAVFKGPAMVEIRNGVAILT